MKFDTTISAYQVIFLAIVIGGWFAQYVALRTHVADFEIAVNKEFVRIEKTLDGHDERIDNFDKTALEVVKLEVQVQSIENQLALVRDQLSKIDHKLDQVLERGNK